MNRDDILFSFPVKVGHVSTNPVSITLEANRDECKELARLWKIVDVVHLEAIVRLARWKKDGVEITGQFTAKLVQTCIASLKPIETNLNDDILAHFVPEGSKLARRDIENGEIIIDIDGPNIPDTYRKNTIDIATVVAEQVAMSINPYPRDPEARIAKQFQHQSNEDKAPSPFTILQSLKDNLS